jgi:hypothetical protein
MVWPGQPVPVPHVLKVSEVRRDGQWLLPNLWDPDNVFGAGGGLVEAPPEVYLRQFRDTPINDLDALAELCKLGMIRPLGPRPYQELPPADNAQWQAMIARFSVEAGFDWHGDEDEREQISERHKAEMVSPVHAAEVALRVRLMQRTTDHLLAYLDAEPPTRAWRNCTDEIHAWRNFTDVVGAALRDFHIRIEAIAVDEPDDELAFGPSGLDTSLYSAGMLQLVNDLVAGETVHRCANELCRKQFIRQLGRSRFGGHRKVGTRYCSNTCARAQYQREKRRRDRAARQSRRDTRLH